MCVCACVRACVCACGTTESYVDPSLNLVWHVLYGMLDYIIKIIHPKFKNCAGTYKVVYDKIHKIIYS